VGLCLALDIELLKTAAHNAGNSITDAAAHAVATRTQSTVVFTAALDHSDLTLLNTSEATARHLPSLYVIELSTAQETKKTKKLMKKNNNK